MDYTAMSDDDLIRLRDDINCELERRAQEAMLAGVDLCDHPKPPGARECMECWIKRRGHG